jgi:hypothetical protein
MIKAGTGKSSLSDVKKAGKEATEKALSELGNEAKLIIVFSSVNFAKPELLEGVKSVAKNAQIIGCSTGGEIINNEVGEGMVVVMAIDTDQIDFICDYQEDIKGKEREAGRKLAKNIKEKTKKGLKSLMILSDGLVNGQELIEGVQEILGKYFPIVGALSGDNFQFKQTYQYFNEKVLTNCVVGVGFAGKFSFGASLGHGWRPISLSKTVSEGKDFNIEKIEKDSALSFYQEYLGNNSQMLIKEPLSIISLNYPLGFEVEGSEKFIIRTVVSANQKGTLTCAGPIIKNGKARLMLSEIDNGINAAKEITKEALEAMKGQNSKIALVFNCICRFRLFGPTKQKEISSIREIIGENVPLIGFYSYGEIGPLDSKIKEFSFSVLQNSSLCVFLLGE